MVKEGHRIGGGGSEMQESCCMPPPYNTQDARGGRVGVVSTSHPREKRRAQARNRQNKGGGRWRCHTESGNAKKKVEK